MKEIICIILLVFLNAFMLYVIVQLYFSNRMLKKKLKEGKPFQSVTMPDEMDIVGKSQTVFLVPPAPVIVPVPANIPAPEIETEPDVLPEEVDCNLHQNKPDDEELTMYLGPDEDIEDSGELNQGLIYEEIGHAIDVLEHKRGSEADIAKVGKTFSLMPPDFVDVICRNNLLADRVNELIKGHVDGSLPQKAFNEKEFDMDKYV